MRAERGRRAALRSVEWNRQWWDRPEYWVRSGDYWSDPWGGPHPQWHGSILPRIRRFLPVARLLEIAPGYGRWTRFLLEHCDALVGIDLSERCVTACQERFRGDSRAHFFLNDGRSLAAVEDNWVDLAFSYDSLVHVEADVMADYLNELSRKLADDGVAVLHHSNAHVYRHSLEYRGRLHDLGLRLPPAVSRVVARTGLLDWDHYRSWTVSADVVAALSEAVGLRCVTQELVNWGCSRLLIDCISVIARPGSRWDHPRRVVINRHFMHEAESIRLAAAAYTD